MIFHLFRRSSSSRSRSCSPEEPKKTKVEFITSFGGESDEEGVVQGPALPPQLNVSESPHTWSVPLNYVYMGIYNCREYKLGFFRLTLRYTLRHYKCEVTSNQI